MAVAHSTVAELREFGAEVGFEVDGDAELGDGWAAVYYADGPAGGGAHLARRTGAPVFTVAYLDSDVGFVEAVTPAGARWTALLNRDTAEDYEIPLDRYPVEPALAGALAWASAAGLSADPEGIRAALTGSETFAEDLADRLLTALGIEIASTMAE
ncbi:hypothetical protein ACFWBN_19075 [Streptomyces sp. NPDC059989]|uniref:hypothetical protein n=1 Tax=Streptomyces sp. NPDC059989 TaxID=3347026 RepID=UPI0036C02C27